MFGALFAPVPPPEGALLALAREFTPRVQSLGPGETLLDLHGLGRVWRTPQDLAGALLAAAHARGWSGLRVALAGTRVAALVTARGRDGLTVVPPGQEAATLAPLPLDLLDLDEERRDLFRRWGLARSATSAPCPRGGWPSASAWRARGCAVSRAGRTRRRSSPRRRRRRSRPRSSWNGRSTASSRSRSCSPACSSRCARTSRSADGAPPGMELDLGLVDGRRHRRALHPAAPSAEARTWRTLMLLDLEAHPPDESIQAFTVRAEPTSSRTVQFSLLDPAQPSPERLAETMARLHEWTAARAGGRARARGLAPAGRVRDGDVRARTRGRIGRRHRSARPAPRAARVPSSAARAGGPARRRARVRLRRRRARGSGRARGALARVRRLVGRGLEPRGVGRLPARRAASTGSSATACATNGSWRASWTDARAYYGP